MRNKHFTVFKRSLQHIAIATVNVTLLALPGYADTLFIPIAQQGKERGAIELPVTGQKQQAVREQYGEPLSTSAATGQPPISRWHYQDFTVYFENATVIHSVLKHRPQHPVTNSNQQNK